MNSPRLFIGPMSKEIVDLVMEYSKSNNVSLGMIPSRRQIENTGGYVNDWKTDEFTGYVRERSNDIFLVRDHGGPSQGNQEDDGIGSLLCDINSGFDILHIDPWKCCENIDDGIKKTLDIIEESCLNSESVKFEIGTEAAIFPYSSDDLLKILSSLRENLQTDFERITYAVVQSGVQISGTKNVGLYNPLRLKNMVDIVHDFGILSKEHNGDYLTKEQIQERATQGLDCINIAPEFGVMQTKLLIDSVFSDKDFLLAYSECEKSKKYMKWVPEDLQLDPTIDKRMIVEVSGHYSFTKEPFRSLVHKTNDAFKKALFKRFDDILSVWE